MKGSYYFFNPGRIARHDNTIQINFYPKEGEEPQRPRHIPVEHVDELYLLGSMDANSAFFNFVGKHGIMVHFFDYYENYTGSFYPKEYLLSGRLLVKQVEANINFEKRLSLAKAILKAAAYNMNKNLQYYQNRDKDLLKEIETIETLRIKLSEAKDISELMGIEGNIRETYYTGFDKIVDGYTMNGRSKQPPENELNAMISFGNGLCYAACVRAIYHTQLNPSISYLHVPGERRFSLSLDIAEIFKPVITDRLIFKLLNKREIQKKDFIKGTNGCFLNENGRNTFARAYDNRLKETIEHRELKKKVSYKQLIQLECYKLIKDLMGLKEYKGFKMRW
ncbi:MAG: type I-B CRISPR-associated endonuclease Cas1 [Leptospiraceae bacterium]|nr:type I-B CRISPR-associated endonuclease Cas1 [Leptospiraceae bacterium]MCP5503389.1 type I-B CRISPR-associated endonuclease Cas1 [Leptospiraceae bacterium]